MKTQTLSEDERDLGENRHKWIVCIFHYAHLVPHSKRLASLSNQQGSVGYSVRSIQRSLVQRKTKNMGDSLSREGADVAGANTGSFTSHADHFPPSCPQGRYEETPLRRYKGNRGLGGPHLSSCRCRKEVESSRQDRCLAGARYSDRPKPGERPALGSRRPCSRRGRTPNLTKRTLSAGGLTNPGSERKGEGRLGRQCVRGL